MCSCGSDEREKPLLNSTCFGVSRRSGSVDKVGDVVGSYLWLLEIWAQRREVMMVNKRY